MKYMDSYTRLPAKIVTQGYDSVSGFYSGFQDLTSDEPDAIKLSTGRKMIWFTAVIFDDEQREAKLR